MSSLYNLLNNEFGIDEDYNCAEKILYGANKVYNLGLSDESLKLSAGFGGGMGIESTCGVVTAGIMVLSTLFVQERAHESSLIKEKTSIFINKFIKEMNSINCYNLKENYYKEDIGCNLIIFKSAEILDNLYNEIKREV